ncbi:MAG: selenocysteine-specific translation elongation factor, partial [Pseudomonadota bacterium]
MKSCAVAVVGHVDHGKTSLVRALTGQETDRLAEEKARGLSIELGFAHRSFDTGIVDFIDSPGHEDFIRAMVCGASGAQAALVVISAVDGVERQTLEHLEILGHLGVVCGVVALTKSDLVAEHERSSVRAHIRDALDGSPFADEPHVFCSATTGEGLGALNDALEALVHRAPPPAPLPGAVLPIDRAFTVKGVGTVTTGTLLGKPMLVGDEVVLMPAGVTATVRRLQSRSAEVDAAQPGMRTAVNLRGIALEDLGRGDVIAPSGASFPSQQIDAWVSEGKDKGALKHGDEIRVLIGTASHVAKVSVWGELKQVGETGGYVRLRFNEPVATHAQQRGILRRLSPAKTLGGLLVLDPAAPPIRRRDQTRLSVLQAAHSGDLTDLAHAMAKAGKGIVHLPDLLKLSGLADDQVPELETCSFEVIDGQFVSPLQIIDDAKAAFLQTVRDEVERRPALAAVPTIDVHRLLRQTFADPLLEHVTRALLEAGELTGDRHAVSLANRDPFSGLTQARRERLARLEDALSAGGLSPPALSELQGERGRDSDLVELLVASGRAVFLKNVSLKQTLLFHTEALEIALGRLREAFPPPREFTMSDARAA